MNGSLKKIKIVFLLLWLMPISPILAQATYKVSTLFSYDTVGFRSNDQRINFSPRGLAFDSKNNIYIADSKNNCIRKLSPIGLLTIFAGCICGGSGDVDGKGTQALFNQPNGLAIDKNDNVYVADYGNHKIRKISPNGVVSTFAGNGNRAYKNGLGSEASFNCPRGIAVDFNDNIYVADFCNNCVRKIDSKGEVSTYAGAPSKKLFDKPLSLTVDTFGNLYVIDYGNNVLKKVTSDKQVFTHSSSISLINPRGITTDRYGKIVLAESHGTIIEIDPKDGTLTYKKRQILINGNYDFEQGNFVGFIGASINKSGNLIVASPRKKKVYIINNKWQKGTLINSRSYYSVFPTGLAVDNNENVYFYDHKLNHIFILDSIGILSPYFKNGEKQSGWGRNYLIPRAFDNLGNLYAISNRHYGIGRKTISKVVKISPEGQLTIIAGSDKRGFADGRGTNAVFNTISDIVINNDGIIFVADYGNHKIRKITPDGVVSTYAGTGIKGYKDSTALHSMLDCPSSLSIDSLDNLYIGENSRIRKISSTGQITTIAESKNKSNKSGNDTSASFSSVDGIDVSKNGEIFFSDWYNNKICKISTSGLVSIIAGNGEYSRVDGTSNKASFCYPKQLKVTKNGKVFINEWGNNAIRLMIPSN